MNTPILFLVFNRPETTKRVFEKIREARPPRLYVSADGPRPGRDGEAVLCEQTRRIACAVDWPCSVKTLFREKNLGCKFAVSSGISWFFENEPEGIILEDDCFPEATFFPYCEELLARYRDNPRVAHIGGTNFQDGSKRGEASYYFSRYAHVWGWASWRRAWQNYDVHMNSFPEFLKEDRMSGTFPHAAVKNYWLNIFSQVYEGKIDTWDYQWVYSAWRTGALAVIPAKNLIANIGFGAASTHTPDADNPFSNMPTYSMPLPLVHPLPIEADDEADLYTFKHHFTRPFHKRVAAKLKRMFRKLRN